MTKKTLLPFLVFLLFIQPAMAGVEAPYVRLDSDSSGFYVWLGANLNLSRNLKLTHDVVYYPGSNALATEIGPYFSLGGGKLDILPMLGLYMSDVGSGRIDYMMAELYLYSTLGKWYGEGWNLYYAGMTDATRDYPFFYGRYFLLYQATPWLAIGPHAEFNLDLSDQAPRTLTNFQVGGALRVPYGEKNTFLVFLGVDTRQDNRFVTRISFTRYF